MKPFFRLLGWTFVVFGGVLAWLASEARHGVAPLGIDFFGGSIKSPEQGARWVGGSVAVVVIGLALLFFTRRDWRKV